MSQKLAYEIISYLGSSKWSEDEFLEHVGLDHIESKVGPGSGRYHYGSGDKPIQRPKDFLQKVEQLKLGGWKETPENIKNTFGLSINDYRAEKRICKEDRQAVIFSRVRKIMEEHPTWGDTQIGRELGNISESTVRGYKLQMAKTKENQTRDLAESLKKRIDESKYGMIDVGKGVEKEINVSREKLDAALYLLEKDGYGTYSNRIPQPTNKNNQTIQKVLCKPEIKPANGKNTPSELYNYDQIETLTKYISRDNGKTLEKKFNYPESLDSKRLKIRYAEDKDSDGIKGVDKDGVIELRRGVKDLSLNGDHYSQVRILVDGTHYLKGMAVYGDDKDFPPGVDVIFNTNKPKGTPVMDPDKNVKQVLKNIKKDPENPFGSTIKDADQGGQYWYTDEKGKKKLGLINKKSAEGDWTEWSDALPSQFLSKQNITMIKKQLDLAKANKTEEFEEINNLTNPVIKKYYLQKFADGCDKAAVDLKAAALPGQKYHVIIPNNTLKENEIYAPGYADGTKLALVRYPHSGTFEIPVCTVNNKNKLGQKLIGKSDTIDAVCINKKVADQLSGADFDGDTVMCIPTDDPKGKVKVSRRPYLQDLKGFDPGMYEGEPVYDSNGKIKTDSKGNKIYKYDGHEFTAMSNRTKQREMGVVSNLITDMTLQGANDKDLAMAVKHSMVVIDAEKHKYDYKASEIDNEISRLKAKYQIKRDADGNIIGYGGAGTIVSRAKGEERIDKRQGQPKVNIKGKSYYDPSKPEGSLIYTQADPSKLYFAVGSIDQTTGIRTMTTVDGKKISYDTRDPKAKDKYAPVLHVAKDGTGYYTNKKGDIVYRTAKRTESSTRMAEADDARTLMGDPRNPKEIEYANYANSLKALANNARLEIHNTKDLQYNPSAARQYAQQVSSLEAKLNDAQKNAWREREALRKSNVELGKRISEDPSLSGEDLKKLGQRSLSKNREEIGSVSRRKRNITIDDKEWEAIQAGAISNNKLKQILDNSDPDSLRQRAMPKQQAFLSSAQIERAKRMADSNFTIEQIAKKMGVSKSTLYKYLKGVE